jgi:hypothetical protein
MFANFNNFINTTLATLVTGDIAIYIAIAVAAGMLLLGLVMTYLSNTARSRRNISKYNKFIHMRGLNSRADFYDLDVIITKKKSCITASWTGVYPDSICAFMSIANYNNVISQARPAQARNGLLLLTGVCFAAFFALFSTALCVVMILWTLLLLVMFTLYDVYTFGKLALGVNVFLGYLYRGIRAVFGVKTCVCQCVAPGYSDSAVVEQPPTSVVVSPAVAKSKPEVNTVEASATELVEEIVKAVKKTAAPRKPATVRLSASQKTAIHEKVESEIEKEIAQGAEMTEEQRETERQRRREKFEAEYKELARLAKEQKQEAKETKEALKAMGVAKTTASKAKAETNDTTVKEVVSKDISALKAEIQAKSIAAAAHHKETIATAPPKIESTVPSRVTSTHTEREITTTREVTGVTTETKTQDVYVARDTAATATQVTTSGTGTAPSTTTTVAVATKVTSNIIPADPNASTNDRLSSLQERLKQMRQSNAASSTSVSVKSESSSASTSVAKHEATGKYDADEVRSALASLFNASKKGDE